jgi:hypothetical protein
MVVGSLARGFHGRSRIPHPRRLLSGMAGMAKGNQEMIVEEGGKVATGIIEGLKTQPLALALIVINVLFLGFMAFIIHSLKEQAERKDALLGDLARNCTVVKSQELLKR